MTLAVQGRTLPANFGAYPAQVEGVEGHVLSINGTAAFFDNAACDAIASYLAWDRDSLTAPVDVIQEPTDPRTAPQYRRHSDG